jgi:hypothetical protein
MKVYNNTCYKNCLRGGVEGWVYEEHFRGRLHLGLYLQSDDISDFQVY